MLLSLLLSCLHTAPELPMPAFIPGPVRVARPELEGVLLFADEQRTLQIAVGEFLMEQGYSVVPLSEQEAALSAAPDCASAHREDALSQHYPDTEVATLVVRCQQDCTLALQTAWPDESRAQTGRHTVRWTTTAESPRTDRLLAALPKLTPPVGAGGLARLEPSHPPTLPLTRGVAIDQLETDGQWGSAPVWAALDAMDLTACWADREQLSYSPILLSIDADGALTRCEASGARPAPETDCACRGLAGADFGAGRADRRASFRLTSHQPPAVNRAGQIIRAHLPIETGIGSHSLSTCLARAPQAAPATIPVHIAARDDEEATPRETEWPGWVDESARVCLELTLSAAQLSCPTGAGGQTVRTELTVDVR